MSNVSIPLESPVLHSPTDPACATADPITVLHVGDAEDDCRSLRDIFWRTGWRLKTAATVCQGLLCLYRSAMPVVISHCDLPDGNWRILLKGTEALPCPPRIIVSSRLADDRLWAEVLNLGGHDVLTIPFAAREVRHVIAHAWSSWHREFQPPPEIRRKQ